MQNQEHDTTTDEQTQTSERLRQAAERMEPEHQPIKLPDLDPREYDTDAIDEFLDLVFHAVTNEERVLTWKAKPGGTPGYPIADDKLIDNLRRTKAPLALYYGTSTCEPDPATGKLYNRKALFKALHVVVLDDIGTKVPVDKLPEGFEPTYIIESSKGNYQYGYVLDAPVTDLEAATMLVQLVYDAGLSDGGGKMATKLVRAHS